VVEAANDLTVGRFNIADTTFVIDDVMTVKP
jgi:hypothetical protein